MPNQKDYLNVSKNEQNNEEVKDNSTNSFLKRENVTSRKNGVFKIRTQVAIESTGLSNREFYSKAEITRQQWYYWSWNIEPFPKHIQIKLCDLFGKPFRDFFLGLE